MKKCILLALVLAAGINFSSAQSFSDDFESYAAGSYLAKSNPSWKTWNNKPGTTEDVKISNAKAHSGANSIYFSSVSGGPSDILLPFGAVYKSGKMTVEMQVFVEAGKIGYFNLQANAKPGEVWALDMNFKEDGTFEAMNTTDGVLATGAYTQNAWHHIKLDINLSINSWELFIDGASKGIFSNSNMQIASIDLYSMANSSFYVDDVAYTYNPAPTYTLNAAVINIDNVSGLAGQAATPSVTVRNLGSAAITKYDVSVSYNGNVLTKQVTGLNMAPLATHTVTLDGTFSLVAGQNPMVATISNINGGTDEDNADDSKTRNIDPIVPAPGKMVVGEEATGTWCGWCPRGAVYMDRMYHKYPGLFIPIAVHNNDPMENHWYDVAIGTRISGYPSMLVDRGTKIDPSAVESDLLKRIVVAPKGAIEVGSSYEESTNTLRVSLTTTFNENVSGKYAIACALTEDGVTGTAIGYAQANYYAGGGQGKMEGYESKPNPVPASQMVYDHVARAISPHFSGASVFPSSITAGTKFTHTFTFNISGYNRDKIHIVGMLLGPDGMTDNGAMATIDEAVSNGLESGQEIAGITTFAGPDELITVYPNPAKDMITVNITDPNATLTILDMSGREVSREMISRPGTHQFAVSSLSEGLYMVRVVTADKIYSAKFVVTK